MRILICFIAFFIFCSCEISPQQQSEQVGFTSEEEAWLSVIPAVYHDEFRVWFNNDSNRKNISINNECTDVSNVDFRDELLRLREVDQKIRNTIPIDFGAMQRVDHENGIVLKRLLKKYGWPEFCDIGLKGVNDLWLLFQHSTDLEFVDSGMKWLETLYKAGKVRGQQYAYSYDRFMRINKGFPQKYGTQTQCDKSTNKAVFLPIEDEKNIDKIRDEIGLIPLKIYIAVINETDRSCDVK